MGDPPSNSTSQTEPTSGSIGPSSESQGGILGTTGLVEEPYGPVSPFPSNPDTVPSKTTSNTTSGEYRRTNNLANLPWNGDATESPKTPSRMSPVMNPDTPRSPRDHSPSMFTELPARSHERRNSIPDSQSAPVQSPSKSASAHVSQEALPTQEKIPPAQKPRPVNDTTSREIPYASLEQMITWQAKCESKIRRHFMKHPPESPPQGYLMSRLQNRDHVRTRFLSLLLTRYLTNKAGLHHRQRSLNVGALVRRTQPPRTTFIPPQGLRPRRRRVLLDHR